VTEQIGVHGEANVGEGGGDPAAIEETLDRLSLRQALLDFDVANARVTDLTTRLVEAQQELVGLRYIKADTDAYEAVIAELRTELAEVKSRHEEVTESSTYRILMVLSRFRVRLGF